MKSIKNISIIFGLLILGAFAFFLISGKSEKDVEKQKIEAISFANSMSVPESVEFCGEKISLDRIDMHERFDREMNSFVYMHSTTMLLFKRANRYFPIIEPILKRNGIPDDFKYLAVIESSLNPRALSIAKAVGVWQFMPETATRYGLEVGTQVDERYHVEKSTEAACRYLKESYDKYGNWATSAASYNAGSRRISTELSEQMAGSAFDLLLVEETSRYVFRILAAKEIFSNPYKYGIILKKEDLYPFVRTRKVEVSSEIPNLAAFAKENKISYYQLKEFNPWLRERDLKISEKSSKTYQIDIPLTEDLYYSKNKVKVHDKAWITND